MKQKVSPPVAVAIVVVISLAVIGLLYKKFMYQPTYSIEDVKANYLKASKNVKAPPNRPQ